MTTATSDAFETRVHAHVCDPDDPTRLLGGTFPVQFVYDPADPYAVHLHMRAGRQGWVEWNFARDLLAAGLLWDSGDGDVRIQPTDDHRIRVDLDSPDGHAALAFPHDELADALAVTDRMVPPGTESEHFDLDQALADALGRPFGGNH